MRVGEKRYDLVMLLWRTRGTPENSPERRRVLDLVPKADEMTAFELLTLARYAVEKTKGAPRGMRASTRANSFNATTQVTYWRHCIEAYRRFPEAKRYYQAEAPEVAIRFDNARADSADSLAIAIVADLFGKSEDAIVKWRGQALADPDLAADIKVNADASLQWVASMWGSTKTPE